MTRAAAPGRGDVDLEEFVAAPVGLDQAAGLSVVVHHAGDEDVGAGLRECERERLAEPGVAAGDDGLPAREREEIHREVADVHAVQPLFGTTSMPGSFGRSSTIVAGNPVPSTLTPQASS